MFSPQDGSQNARHRLTLWKRLSSRALGSSCRTPITRPDGFSWVYAFGLFCGLWVSAFAFGGYLICVYLICVCGGALLSLVGATLMLIVMLRQGLAALSTPPI